MSLCFCLFTSLCLDVYSNLKRGLRPVLFMKKGAVEGRYVYLNYISLLGFVHLSKKSYSVLFTVESLYLGLRVLGDDALIS